jgi:acyl transferase domain-containing protein/NAD(P)-dependent dehydrogenase (short-subunit alcohol dehydrogenase family)
MAQKLHQTPIAIIGMASVFPNSMNLREFWNNIVNRADCIIDVPESRWKIDDYYDPDPKAPDKTYSKRGGFLPDIDFDPMEFGLPPNILEVTDVSQMLGLVVARDAMQDAGYADANSEVRDRTGVVLGVGGGQKLITPLTSRLQYPVWRRALESSGIVGEDAERIIEKIKAAYIGWEENSFPGMLGNVIAGRITNRLDLGGTNCVVDAACASSMAAMKLAVAELVNGHADMMITGGVDTDNSPFMYMSFSKTPAFTPGDLPKPFDEESDGMMVGEGVGMIVLKRLADAERDGDRIYAVLRGMGSSSDGRYKSIYAPRGEGQEKALERAYDDAGISPSEVQLIEAHGTGTRAGDATETTTIVRFFNKHIDYTQSDNHQAIALGSVKSQIGHTKAAAGIAGIIKTALALHHKVLPATINVTRPNPKLGLDESPVYVNTQTRPWITNGTPRRAGVSSFGFGGTNFHFVFEEYNHDHKGNYRIHNTADTVIFHAETPEALIEKMQKVVNNLRAEDAEGQYLNLAQYSRVTNIPASDARVGFVAGSADEAIDLLDASIKFMQAKPTAEEWQHPKGIFYRRQALPLNGQVVALFSGQGSQYVNMGRELGLNFAPIRESFSKIDALFKQDNLPLVSNVVYPAPAFDEAEQKRQDQLIQRTDYVQPAIGALSAGLYQLFQRAGFQPDFVAGHSFGELTALWAGGVLNDDDYYRLVKARGLAMAPPADPNFDAGSMLAVTGDVSNLKNDIAGHNGVYMANINSPRQVVLAGNTSALATAKADLERKGYNVVNLPVSAAFHTPLVGHAQTPFAHAVAQADFKPARIPVYSNATAQPYPADADGMRRTLSEHILQSVNFHQEIENIYNAGGRVFIEFGPRNVLTNLTKDILGDKPHVAIALNSSRQKDSDRQFREAVAHLRVLGLELAEVDPHASDPVKPASAGRKKGMSVKINGGAYLSEGHKKRYQEILNDGFTVKGGGVREVVKEVIKEVPVEVIKEVEVIREVQVPVASNVAPVASTPAPTSTVNFSDALSLFSQQQSKTLKAHQQYLENQAEYIRIFTELTAQQQTAVQSGALSGELASQISQSMDALHAHQAETLRVHETYLQRQSEQTQALIGAMRGGNLTPPTPPTAPVTPPKASTPASAVVQAVAPVQQVVVPVTPAPVQQAVVAEPVAPVQAPAPVANTSGITLEALSSALLNIVSDKTGYPSEMLELEMDIEADLGIDSIKRVEILGAMRDEFPSLPDLPAEDLAELRTLDEIVQYMAKVGGLNGASAPAPVAPAPVQQAVVAEPAPVVQTPVAVANTSGITLEALSSALLNIVSDKTGYPSEMLELEMDIEADLGIDSIKRVEILGAMRDEFPALPDLPAEDLAELRTLDEIVQYMAKVGGLNGASAVAPAPVQQAVVAEPAPVVQTPAPVANTSGITLEALSSALLNIVSDKTGYPSEMLELEMDIEADLGIDSIKRVEILGAMRDEFPALPDLPAEDLAELRTLDEIVQYMAKVGGLNGASAVASTPAPVVSTPAPVVTEPVAPAPVANTSGITLEALSSALLNIVSDKTGYPSEMLELEMDIEADLGIDSIKRVEILGAMRDEFPSLPDLPAEDLAELRTLDEIVQYMAKVGGASLNGSTNGNGAHAETDSPKASAPEKITGNGIPLALPKLDHDIPRVPAMIKRLPQPDFMDVQLPQGSVCLVTNDGTELTGLTAQKLIAQGWSVVVVNFSTEVIRPTTALPAGIPHVQLSDTSEASIENAIQSINETYGKVAGYIQINPSSHNLGANGDLFVNKERDLVKQGFLFAKHLKRQLNENASLGYALFATVARLDGAFGTSRGTYGAISGGLFGLTKTVNLEWAGVVCRALDIAADLDAQTASDALVAELHDPNHVLIEVAINQAGRKTLVADVIV